MVGFIVTTPGFPAAILSILWVKTSTKGAIIGAVSGLAAGITAVLSGASTFPGGLGNFLVNMSENYSVLAGSTCSFFVSIIVTIVVSLFTHKVKDKEAEFLEWQKLRDIDNPLNPWGGLFKEECPALNGARPSADQLNNAFRRAKWAAYIGGAFTLVLFIVIMPSVMGSMHILTSSQFKTYLLTLQVWCFMMAGVVVIVAPVEEGLIIFKRWREGKRPAKKHFGGNALEQETILT